MAFVNRRDTATVAFFSLARFTVAVFTFYRSPLDGLVAEWLACWTQAQKDLGSNRSRDAVG